MRYAPADSTEFEEYLKKTGRYEAFVLSRREEEKRVSLIPAAEKPTHFDRYVTIAEQYGYRVWQELGPQVSTPIGDEQTFDFDGIARTTDADYFDVIEWVFQHLGCSVEKIIEMGDKPPGPAMFMLKKAEESDANYRAFMALHNDRQKFLRQKDTQDRSIRDDKQKQLDIIDEFLAREMAS